MSTKNFNAHQEDKFNLESTLRVSENEWEAQIQATTKGQEEDNEDMTSLAEKSQTLSLNEVQKSLHLHPQL
jgi:hypothetical protein